MKRRPAMAVIGVLVFLIAGSAFAEETVGCPHDVGKGRFKVRNKEAYIQMRKCYSDEVWKALRDASPYPADHDEMVDLPEGWHQEVVKTALGLEYGVIDRLSVGLFLPYVMKDLKRQVWSKKVRKATWKELRDRGFEDIWVSIKWLAYSNPQGLFGSNWEEGLFLALSYRLSVSSDDDVKNGIGSGAREFKLVLLFHPHFTEKSFLCGDMWYHYRGRVREIKGFTKSGWNLGDRFGYRIFFGYEFLNRKFAIVGGPQGWIAQSNRDKDGRKIEDSHMYSHGVMVKFRWQPFGEEEKGSIDLGVRIPYSNKTTFAPSFVPIVCGRIKF